MTTLQALHPIGKDEILRRPDAVAGLVSAFECAASASSSCNQQALLHQSVRCLGSLFLSETGRMQLLALRGSSSAAAASAPTLVATTKAAEALHLLVQMTSHEDEALADSAARAIAHACASPHSAAATFLSLPDGINRVRELVAGLACKRQRTATSIVLQLAIRAAAATGAGSSSLDAAQLDAALLECFIKPLVALLSDVDDSEKSQGQPQAAAALAQLAGCNLDGDTTAFAILIVQVRFAHPIGQLNTQPQPYGMTCACARGRPLLLVCQAGGYTVLREHALCSVDARMQETCASALEALNVCLTPTSRRPSAIPSHVHITSSPSDTRRPRRGRCRKPSPLSVGAPFVQRLLVGLPPTMSL